MKIILASKSPRRKELLKLAGISDFTVSPAVGEETADPSLSAADAIKLIALCKAREVAARFEKDDLIIAADTLVYLDGTPLGKPKDAADAHRMLRALSGRPHTVRTGVAVIRGSRELSACEETEVFFRELTDTEIDEYIASGEPMDKAGAYGIQGGASRFIPKITGDYSNVVGLPVCRTSLMINELIRGDGIEQNVN